LLSAFGFFFHPRSGLFALLQRRCAEIVPCGVVCGNVLFLYGNNYRLCETDPLFPSPAPGSRNGAWYYDRSTFPSGKVKYNGEEFTVPDGGVYLCDSNVFGCNNPACQGGPPGPPAPPSPGEESCHMDDDNLTTCCPLTPPSPPSNFLDWLRQQLADLPLPLTLKVRDFEVSQKFTAAADYYFGRASGNTLQPGVLFKLAPPDLLRREFPTEEERLEKRREWAKWGLELQPESGTQGENALNDGKLQNVEPYRFAVENLRDFLVAIPKREGATSQRREDIQLARTPEESAPNPHVLAASEDELCLPVVEAPTQDTCTPEDTPGAQMTVGRFLQLISGGLKLFPKIADLDKIGHYTAGVETDPEGKAQAEDPHYEDGGSLEIFKLPGESYEDRTARGSAHLSLTIGPIGPFPAITIPLGRRELKLRHQGADTRALEDEEKGVWAKLTSPQVEDRTLGHQMPEIHLASSPVVQGAAYYPQNTSLAERIGRILGSWLGKLTSL